MARETKTRKELKKQLVAEFKKAFAKDAEFFGTPADMQNYAAQMAVKQADEKTKGKSDLALRRAFNKVVKETRKALDEAKFGAVFSSLPRPTRPEPETLRPDPQPPSVYIPGGNSPFKYG